MLEEMRNENIRNFLRSQRPWLIVPPTFPAFAPRYALFHPDTNTSKIVWCYTDAEYYFQDQGLNFYLTKDEFDNEKRPVLDFFVDSPEDLNVQFWKRYIFIWPAESRSITLTLNLPGSHSRNNRRRRYRK